MYTTKYYKDLAKDSMRGTKPNIFLYALIYVAILTLLSIFTNKLSGIESYLEEIKTIALSGGKADLQDYINMYKQVTVPAGLLMAAISLMTGFLQVGYQGYCLKVSRKQETKFTDLFIGFEHFGRTFLLMLLKAVLVFLWTLLFIVPGIIAVYRYSQCYYLMFEHPELSAMDCIDESKRIMKGHKGELFVLNLSFIGWALLDGLVSVMVGYSVLMIWTAPYFGLTYAHYYNTLVGYKAPESAVPPVWEPGDGQ